MEAGNTSNGDSRDVHRSMYSLVVSLVVRRDWNFLGNAGRKHQGSFNLAEVLAAFLTKFQFRLTTKLDNQTHVR
jgi:NADH/NAD ratio-sensing transcriptional regulator Rex